MHKKKKSPLEKELTRRSRAAIIGAMGGNPGAISYLLSKYVLRKKYAKKVESEKKILKRTKKEIREEYLRKKKERDERLKG
ncbi:MAG: hypothetical protein ACW964_09120 [Candidatus Hodarchaeales archaeon]